MTPPLKTVLQRTLFERRYSLVQKNKEKDKEYGQLRFQYDIFDHQAGIQLPHELFFFRKREF